jgi:hypothetical protein
MVNKANKTRSKQIEWTEEGRLAFSTVKDRINACPKLCGW